MWRGVMTCSPTIFRNGVAVRGADCWLCRQTSWRSPSCPRSISPEPFFVPLAVDDPSDQQAGKAVPVAPDRHRHGILTVEIGAGIVLRVPGDVAVERAAALVRALRGEA